MKHLLLAGVMLLCVKANYAKGPTTDSAKEIKPVTGESITVTIGDSKACKPQTLRVHYSITGRFKASNVFTLQLSDASGNFDNPVNIASVSSAAGGHLSGLIPKATPLGTGYKIRVIATSPVIISDALDITVAQWRFIYTDISGNGHGDPSTATLSCDITIPAGYVGARQSCYQYETGVWIDEDGDRDGNMNSEPIKTCSLKPRQGPFVTGNSDCNDDPEDNGRLMNSFKQELCDGIDNNCNGEIDEGFDRTTFYRDADGDKYGDPAVTVLACVVPAGYVVNNRDCNDDPARNGESIKPGMAELCDGIDNNCDGVIDEGCPCPANAGAGNLVTSNITSVSAQLNWSSIADPQQWQIQYTTISQMARWTDVLVAGNARSSTITSLTAKGPYYWKIRAKCNGKWMEYSMPVLFQLAATSSAARNMSIATEQTAYEVSFKESKGIQVSPNPTNGTFALSMAISETVNANAKIEIVNTIGQTVKTLNGYVSGGYLTKAINIPASLVYGVYVVRITVADKVYVKKLIYQK